MDVKTGLKFALPSLTAIYLTRKLIVPKIPEILFSIGEIAITKNLFIMILFAIVMLMAALSMIQNKKSEKSNIPPNPAITIIQIFMVGVVIGLVGAGGGFLIISILGIFAGIYLNKFINEKNLKKGFGWFVLTMSILILTKELLF